MPTIAFSSTRSTASCGMVRDSSPSEPPSRAEAIASGGDLTQVGTAVSRAELALQTTVAIRDRVVQAYQEIIRMPI